MPAVTKTVIAGQAGNLEIATHLPDGAIHAIAIVAHPLPTMGGTMENKVVTTLAKTFADLQFATVRFNFRGTGNSHGTYDEGNGETGDALAVAHHARQIFGVLPLVLAGFSFGGYVQARAAQHLHPQRLVLIAPAVGRFAMPAVPSNSLVIHGELDEVVPLQDVMLWARPQHLPVVVLPDTEHFFHGRLNLLRQLVTKEFSGNPL